MKKIIYSAILLMSIIGVVACGNRNVTTDIVLNDLVTGLENRWDLTMDEDAELPELERYELYNEAVQSELEMLEKYREATYEDEDLGVLIRKYINALDRQKEAYDYKADKEQWGNLWNEGREARKIYLKAIEEKYGLSSKFSEPKYVYELEDITGVYTQISLDEITNIDWKGTYILNINGCEYEIEIDKIDDVTKTCEVKVSDLSGIYEENASGKGTILDNKRIVLQFKQNEGEGILDLVVNLEENKYIVKSRYENISREDIIYSMAYIIQNKNIEEMEMYRNDAIQEEDIYIFPDSDKKYLTEDEIRQVTVDEMLIGRNEIFARHGRMFNMPELKEYFEQQSWYQGTIPPEQFDTGVLNDFEKKNIELIQKIENEINGVVEFIGLAGTYICIDTPDDWITGKIEILGIGDKTVSFSLGSLDFSYDFISGEAEIIDSKTIQYTNGSFVLTMQWVDQENIYVTNSGELTEYMDAATIDVITESVKYNRAYEFNQW